MGVKCQAPFHAELAGLSVTSTQPVGAARDWRLPTTGSEGPKNGREDLTPRRGVTPAVKRSGDRPRGTDSGPTITAVRGGAPVAPGRPCVRGGISPTAAAQGTKRTGVRAQRIGDRSSPALASAPPIPGPLPEVPDHVVEPPRIRLFSSHWVRPAPRACCVWPPTGGAAGIRAIFSPKVADGTIPSVPTC